MVPRFLWVFLVFVVYTVAGVAGREHFSAILSNFLSVLSYWTAFFIVIVAEEHFLFRREGGQLGGYNLADWDNPSKYVVLVLLDYRNDILMCSRAASQLLYRILIPICLILPFHSQTSDWDCWPIGVLFRDSWRRGRNVSSMVHRTDRENGWCDVRCRSRIRSTVPFLAVITCNRPVSLTRGIFFTPSSQLVLRL